ncbi:hypothetical protein SDC9_107478 [bioreactor metagenome]|uniref:Uncharacterized protein n=1 Tax=bioreactor metagenome TaxID=1076179 RepID=A0A645B6E3_9ZZZZ
MDEAFLIPLLKKCKGLFSFRTGGLRLKGSISIFIEVAAMHAHDPVGTKDRLKCFKSCAHDAIGVSHPVAIRIFRHECSVYIMQLIKGLRVFEIQFVQPVAPDNEVVTVFTCPDWNAVNLTVTSPHDIPGAFRNGIKKIGIIFEIFIQSEEHALFGIIIHLSGSGDPDRVGIIPSGKDHADLLCVVCRRRRDMLEGNT